MRIPQDRLHALKRSRPGVEALFEALETHWVDWTLTGGCLRGMLLGEDDEPRDLDVAILADDQTFHDVVSYWKSRCGGHSEQNSLGGYKLSLYSHYAPFSIDVWPLANTVGIDLDGAPGPYDALVRRAPASIYAVAMSSSGTLYEHGFFDTLRDGVIRLGRSAAFDEPGAAKLSAKIVGLADRYGLRIDDGLSTAMVRGML